MESSSPDPPAPPLKRVGKRGRRPQTSAKARAALRAIIAEHETRCAYCKVPTAATIEHVIPVDQGGRSVLSNLVLACPYCNTQKRERPVSEFVRSGDWQLPHPQLPESPSQLLREKFGFDVERELSEADEVVLATGSIHSQLLVRRDGTTAILVRPGKGYTWRRTEMGSLDNPQITHALYDFLARHYTPAHPR